jgi:hypothetical protein
MTKCLYERNEMGAAGKHGELELDYLAAEARDARIAMRTSLLDLKTALLTKADPRGFTREHPRIAVGLAAAVGIAAGAALGARRVRGKTSATAHSVPPAAESSATAAESSTPDETSHGAGRRPGPARAARGMFVTWIVGAIQGALGSAFRLAVESALAAWAAAAVQAPQGSSAEDSIPCTTVPCTTLDGEDLSNAETPAETEGAVESPLCVARGQK